MELNILSREKNPLLHREEIQFEIKKAKTTPSRKEVKEKIAAMCNAETELVVVEKIIHSFGKHYSAGNAKIYKSKEHRNAIESKYTVNRNLGIKKKASEKKEEKPEKPPKAEEKKVEITAKKPEARVEKDEEKKESKEEKPSKEGEQ